MDQFATRADIVRLSDGDFAYLYGGSDYAGRAEALFAAGTRLFIVTHGVRGVQAWHPQAGSVEVEAPPVNVIDTVGAGDSFQAALLFALWSMDRVANTSLARLDAAELTRALQFAAGCAAVTCGRRGADPPRLPEVDATLLDILGAPLAL
jgi:fructokinase